LNGIAPAKEFLQLFPFWNLKNRSLPVPVEAIIRMTSYSVFAAVSLRPCSS